MFYPRIHYIYLVVDRNGLEDLLDVTSVDDIPSKWICATIIRSYVE